MRGGGKRAEWALLVSGVEWGGPVGSSGCGLGSGGLVAAADLLLLAGVRVVRLVCGVCLRLRVRVRARRGARGDLYSLG